MMITDSEPVFFRLRRLNYAERSSLKDIIKNLIHEGIIRPSDSVYASPIVLVKKKNGDTLMCDNYREFAVFGVEWKSSKTRSVRLEA